MKKLLGIAFVGMMALGCGGGSKSTPESQTGANPPAQQTDPNAPAGDATQNPAQQTPAN